MAVVSPACSVAFAGEAACREALPTLFVARMLRRKDELALNNLYQTQKLILHNLFLFAAG